jgi:hypothetical protein
MGHHPAQNAALLEQPLSRRAALSRHHEHHPVARGLAPAEEGEERLVRLGLPHSVEIDHGIDGPLAAAEAGEDLALDTGERRRRRRR